MTKADKILLAGLLLASLITGGALYGRWFLPAARTGQVQAVVSVQGKVVRTVELHPDARLTWPVQGGRVPATVEVDGVRVRMLEAGCANGICLKQGWIEQPGQSVVCVPGEIVIRIEGAAALDAVTR
jgi:hypothetical protein